MKPTFQNYVEKPVTRDSDEISSVLNSNKHGTSSDIGELHVVDYNNTRVQEFDARGDFILRWGLKGKSNIILNYLTEEMQIRKGMVILWI